MTRLRAWFHRLSDQWKATLRTMYQNALAAILVFSLGLISVLTGLVNGGTIDDAVTETRNLAKLLLLALFSVVSGLITFAMNRPGSGASYEP